MDFNIPFPFFSPSTRATGAERCGSRRQVLCILSCKEISIIHKGGCYFTCLEPTVLHLTSSLIISGYLVKVRTYFCFKIIRPIFNIVYTIFSWPIFHNFYITNFTYCKWGVKYCMDLFLEEINKFISWWAAKIILSHFHSFKNCNFLPAEVLTGLSNTHLGHIHKVFLG